MTAQRRQPAPPAVVPRPRAPLPADASPSSVRVLLTPLGRVPALKTWGRRAVRGAAAVTSPWRPLPEFLVIGAKRGGTTSLYRYLLAHPQVLPLFPSARTLPLREDMKGVHYFDSHWDRGAAWYRSHFPSAAARRAAQRELGAPVVSGESSPYYLFHPRAAERAARTVPAARVVVMLRDPVDRAVSHWKEQRARGNEPLDLEQALRAERWRLDGEEERLARSPRGVSAAHEHQGYVRQSCYADGLRRWYEHFDREQVLVVWSDDFYRDPQPVFEAVCRHVRIEPRPVADAKVWNSVPAPSPVPEALRAELSERFRPYDDELRAMLGRPLGWSSPA